MKTLSLLLITVGLLVAPAHASVSVSAPLGGIVTSPVTFRATSNSPTCSKGVAAIGVYVDDVLLFHTNGTVLNASLVVPVGAHRIIVQNWDRCGRSYKSPINLMVVPNQVPQAVTVTAPADGSAVSGSVVGYSASATTNCGQGVASMGVYDGSQLIFVSPTKGLNAALPLSTGTHRTTVQSWDYCGGSAKAPVTVTVNAPVVQQGSTFSQIQSAPNWFSWGQQPPNFQDCAPCAGDTWSMRQDVNSPSLSGHATQYNLGGTAPYSDVLFANHLIGPFSSQGIPDPKQVIVPTLHHFVYSGDFYTITGEQTYALELDVNSYPGRGVGLTFGTQCRIFGGHGWDVWDSHHWIHTGKACNPIEGGWNHFDIDVTRNADDSLTYNTITLNGLVNTIGLTYPPFSVPTDWYGVTVNVQLDGDNKQNSVNTIVDNLGLRYW